jgi:purine-binding chemotaxis protein CheW
MMPNVTTGSAPAAAVSGSKHLAFRLGEEEYGLDVQAVQEIIRMLPLTRVPGLPPYMRGVINLRGRILPVLELRRRMGLPEAEPGDNTCIVVVRTEKMMFGLMVDAVVDVLLVHRSAIQPVPDFGVAVDTSYLRGIARIDQRVILLVDIDRVLTHTAPRE